MSIAQEEIPVPVVLSSHWRSFFHLFCKRAFDLFGALLLLLLLSPLLLVLALLVKLTSAGPVLYRWRVVGKGGRPFVGYKFRSMVANADQLKGELAAGAAGIGRIEGAAIAASALHQDNGQRPEGIGRSKESAKTQPLRNEHHGRRAEGIGRNTRSERIEAGSNEGDGRGDEGAFQIAGASTAPSRRDDGD